MLIPCEHTGPMIICKPLGDVTCTWLCFQNQCLLMFLITPNSQHICINQTQIRICYKPLTEPRSLSSLSPPCSLIWSRSLWNILFYWSVQWGWKTFFSLSLSCMQLYFIYFYSFICFGYQLGCVPCSTFEFEFVVVDIWAYMLWWWFLSGF